MIYRLTIYTLVVAVVTVVLLSIWKEINTYSKEHMPVRYVRVEGFFQYLKKEEIKKILMPHVAKDFVSVDMKAIQSTIVSLPWISKAEVKRIWPDAIDIKIYEQKPVARWGEESLLNEQGDIFTPKNITEFTSLPLMQGPAGYEHRLLRVMKNLKAVLIEQSLELEELTVNDRRSWKMVLKNGVRLQLGRISPLKKIERFLKTLALLGEERTKAISLVDMRYPNGFAVTWKSAATIHWEDINDTENKT